MPDLNNLYTPGMDLLTSVLNFVKMGLVLYENENERHERTNQQTRLVTQSLTEQHCDRHGKVSVV